eukprot:TRINITY_DN61714_c0_g1_i1.p1 TRINITY_DN61714_c0_g1~~TRINITY_DN61714_c0_g1_i1.p1  ORF type:complete len:330 (-),score=74.12 TRINITY_DN61714_c0_g1_i1:102-1091(-)
MGFCKYAALVPLLLVALQQITHFATRKQYKVLESGGILITGASSGIGRHAAVSLAKKGFTVYAGVRKQADADSIEAEGVPRLVGVVIDVVKQDTIDSCFDSISEDLAKKGLPFVALVNNAGIHRGFPVELLDMQRDVRENFEVNYFGVVATTQKFLPLLRATGNGARLLQVSSVAGIVSSPGGNPYSATKFAVESLNDALRLELAPFKISVTSINPAFVATPILGRPGDKGEANKQESKRRTTAEGMALYSHLLNDGVDAKNQEFYEMADSPQVTTDAIEHAITSPYPQVRYIVANVGGVPAVVFCYLKWFLPERLLDAITLHVMGVKA